MSIFQPTLPARGATGIIVLLSTAHLFQPTLPARGATCPAVLRGVRPNAFQPTLPARGATLLNLWRCLRYPISTHAPRTGSDNIGVTTTQEMLDFNPRSPHGERPAISAMLKPKKTFQPTLPARGATTVAAEKHLTAAISTHAPRTGSDIFAAALRICKGVFQPTLPARGATTSTPAAGPPRHDFNPRSPHGERPRSRRKSTSRPRFQPTLPARGATNPDPCGRRSK